MSRPSAVVLLFLITVMVVLTASPSAGASKPRAGADLSLIGLGDPPAKVDAGASLRISFAVRNAGSRRATASKIGFSLSLRERSIAIRSSCFAGGCSTGPACRSTVRIASPRSDDTARLQ